MNELIGLWKTYRSGEICEILAEVIRDVTKEGKSLTTHLYDHEPIQSLEQLSKMLSRYERQYGVQRLVGLLGRGLELNGAPEGPHIRIFLRLPERTEEKKSFFKDLISDSTIREATHFTEEYFTKQRSDFFHSRLERSLKKNFGFRFEYKVVIELEGGVKP